MKVMKFGGTSVGSAERMKHVASLIQNGEKKIVVLSAMSGVTNALVDIAACFYRNDSDAAEQIVQKLRVKYDEEIQQLLMEEENRIQARQAVSASMEVISAFSQKHFTFFDEKVVLAQGELISTCFMNLYLHELGVASVLLPALDFMRLNGEHEPDMPYIEVHLKALLHQYPDTELFITQGFICRNSFGEVDNLQRGGSDYTASIIGAAVQASEIQIWTDIDGLHNNDPRVVQNTTPVRQLNFDEAAKLAHFGAKILHPTCIEPARKNNIPVRLLNTFTPEAPGTLISNLAEKGSIKAVAAKDNVVYVKIKSQKVLPNHKFLCLVFDTFAKYNITVDMVTTSEVGVSVTVDENEHLAEVVRILEEYATVEVNRDMIVVCVVGDLEWQNVGYEARIVAALKDIPVRMISYGGSSSNVSIVMRACDKVRALEALNEHVFLKKNI